VVKIHPGVADAARAEAGPGFQAAVDQELAATWATTMDRALEAHGKEPWAAPAIVRAGLAAFPYLSRRQEWQTAAAMIERVADFDHAPATAAALVPRMRRVVEATAGTKGQLGNRGILARLQRLLGQIGEAEAQLRSVLDQAADAGEFGIASTAAGHLANLLRDRGRSGEVLEVLEQKAEYTRRAGLGPWTQLADEGRRLQILSDLGRNEEVLRRVLELREEMVLELREEMKSLPDPPGPNEFVDIWNVRETTLDTGRGAASALEEWQQALDLNGEVLISKRGRNATLLAQARTRFNDYGPLLRLQRYNQAHELLVGCREAFEAENDVVALGVTLSALADLEHILGRPAEAQRFEKAGLRLTYIAGHPRPCRISHFNLAIYVIESQGAWEEVLAHQLAASCISVLTQAGDMPRDLQAVADGLRRAGPSGRAALPANFDALCATVERVEGVRFREMVERLADGRIGGDELLQQVLAQIPEPESRLVMEAPSYR
jgi:tetratricopeptide (TPR) repeat protein